MTRAPQSISRRSLFAWSGTGALGLSVGTVFHPSGSAQATQAVTLTTSASAFTTFAPDFTERFMNALPRTIELAAPGSLAGATLRVDFDSSMIALTGDAAQLVCGDHVQQSPVQPGDGFVTITIPNSVRSRNVVVGVPLCATVRYPGENIGRSAPSKAILTIGDGVTSADFEPAGTGAHGLAWGGAIDVSWQREPTAEASSYYSPALVALTSVGPGPLPAGTLVRVHTDAVLVGEVQPDGAPASRPTADPAPDRQSWLSDSEPPQPDPSGASPKTTVASEMSDGMRTTTITLGDELAAGTTFTVPLSTEQTTPRLRVKAIAFAQVLVEAPPTARAMQRVTGLE